MSKKTDDAIAKITAEAMEINNNFAIFIEEHLTSICTTDKVADKLLSRDKTLEDFCKKCESKARERARKQGSGFQINGLPDQEYKDMVEAYYSITPDDKSRTTGNVIDITDLL
ncbi:hypothetical protein V1225_01725 [Emergencia sp. JLR.KK010]|uniref:hypothetical protein n=1 Tax=Emergencia sp. JLR.KK010 TaxID=3114296 RepID=UPI0030D4B665